MSLERCYYQLNETRLVQRKTICQDVWTIKHKKYQNGKRTTLSFDVINIIIQEKTDRSFYF